MQAVREENGIIQHCERRHDQAPDSVSDIVAVYLSSGSESASEMCCEPDKGYSQDYRAGFVVLHIRSFLSVNQNSSLL